MTVRDLKEFLNHSDPDSQVKICVNTPGGWVCPDGCAVDIKAAYHGIDWHTCEILLVPLNQLDIHDVDEWSGKHVEKEAEPESEPKPERKEPLINGMPVDKYLRTLAKAYDASKNSTLVFK